MHLGNREVFAWPFADAGLLQTEDIIEYIDQKTVQLRFMPVSYTHLLPQEDIMNHGKHYVDSKKLVDRTKLYDTAEALALCCQTAKRCV